MIKEMLGKFRLRFHEKLRIKVYSLSVDNSLLENLGAGSSTTGSASRGSSSSCSGALSFHGLERPNSSGESTSLSSDRSGSSGESSILDSEVSSLLSESSISSLHGSRSSSEHERSHS